MEVVVRNAMTELCLGRFDAITSINEHVFIFKNKFVWRLDANLFLVRGYPMRIGAQFPGIDGELEQLAQAVGGDGGQEWERVVDAAYQRQTDGAVVLFAGHRYWMYNGSDFQLLSTSSSGGGGRGGVGGVQHTIWDLGLPKNVTGIDAVFVWPKNQKTYLFAAESFWKYDDREQRMDPSGSYPRSMIRWHGIPFNVDAVTSFPQVSDSFAGGQTLFFKGNSYWLFNDHWVRPEIGYPKLISSLFNC